MRLIDISTKRRVTIAMFTLAVVLFGVVSFVRLKINLLPDLTYPTLTVRTEYPGAAPAEIENLISKPIEEHLGVVKNVNRVSSISRSGQSDVILEFDWGTDMDYAGLDVREKLDALELPLEVSRPAILRFDPSLDPVMRFGLYAEPGEEPGSTPDPGSGIQLASSDPARNAGSGDPHNSGGSGTPGSGNFTEDELKVLRRFAEEEIKKELEASLGVAAVKVSGGLEDEIQVLIDQARTAQLQLPVEQLAYQLGAENVNLSGGRLEEGTHQYLVRTLNQFRSVQEIGDMIVTYRDGKPVYLKDIALVRHGYKEREAITRLDGLEAVEIAIYKEGDANTVTVAREVEKRLARVRRILPEGVHLTKVYDQATFIQQSVNEVILAGVIGGLLAVIILYFFLRSFKATVIISFSIPVSVIATFNLMYGADLTLNIMSLGGIALGIGMLLDNSIVVLENISRHRDMGKDSLTAARDGASEVSTAVTAATLTTIAVFFPLVFVKGIAGQLFRDQALTVTFALLASLVVALTLIPMLASLRKGGDQGPAATPGEKAQPEPTGRLAFLKRFRRRLSRILITTVPVAIVRFVRKVVSLISRGLLFALTPALNLFQRGYGAIEDNYPPLLKWALGHKASVIITAMVLFAISVALVPILGVELIPQLSQGEFSIEFKLPPGTPLEVTDAAIVKVQEAAGDIGRVRTSFAVAGTGNRMDANPEQGGENWGELSVVLRQGSRHADEEAVMARLRKTLDGIPGLQYKFSRPTLFTFRTPVEIEIAGYELDQLKSVSTEIARRLEASGRFADVKSTMEAGHPEVQIRFDRERAAALGLPVYQIADRVVDNVRGDIATRYSWHDRKIDVLVRARQEDRSSVKKLRQLLINPESDHPVPLEAVADIVIDTGPGEIRRVDQERVALVTANLNYGDLGAAASEINDIIRTTHKPPAIGVRLAGQNEEMTMSFKSLQFALLLAVFLVYLVMASQFESFLHPFVILLTIPLALIGAVLALAITGSTISVVVMIGAILLAGIVVNNAIVLIDLINKLRARGMSKLEAIMEGGRLRLRPIMMTTITTTLGLLPLAIGIGEGAEIRAPMAITVIGGLTVSTLLTLVVIPVVYSALDRKA
ncbi:MAG: efflux RND transporter permease subunit [bacterium]|jgi:HAE1 family hydrophobic/amphiphilic exporter-1